MAEFISDIRLADLKKLTVGELRRLKSCEVVADADEDGEYLFTFVNPQNPYIRTHVEYLCQNGNAVGGEDYEQVVKPLIKEGV